jgi:hypothetical protein
MPGTQQHAGAGPGKTGAFKYIKPLISLTPFTIVFGYRFPAPQLSVGLDILAS